MARARIRRRVWDLIVARHGQIPPSVTCYGDLGFDLDERARTAIAEVPETAWAAVLDDEGHARDLSEAGTVELTGLLRESAGGDRLSTWPQDAGARPPGKTRIRRETIRL
jgi:hypothetical protein